MKKQLVGLFLLLGVFTSTARADFNLLAFQVNALGIFQSGTSGTYTGQVAWIPNIGFGPFGLRGEFGAAFPKNSAGSMFLATNYEGFLTLSVIPMLLSVEAGGGYALWHGQNTNNPILSAYVVLTIPVIIERVFVAYSRFMIPNVPANEIKLGVGFKF